MIIDLSHPSAELPPSSDVLLIGAGTCGLVLADALRRSGLTVTVLESGGRTPDQATERLNEVEQAGAFHYRGATEGRRRSIGGTSLLWGGALLPFQPHDIAPRPGLAPDGWPLGKTAATQTCLGPAVTNTAHHEVDSFLRAGGSRSSGHGMAGQFCCRADALRE